MTQRRKETSYIDMNDDPTIGQIILGASIASIPTRKGETEGEWISRVMKRSMTIARSIMKEESLPMKALDAVKIEAEITSIEFEERSSRYLIKFQAITKDGEEEHPTEEIRTPRIDNQDGEIVKAYMKPLKEGDRVIICKSMDQRNGKKYRVATYINKIK